MAGAPYAREDYGLAGEQTSHAALVDICGKSWFTRSCRDRRPWSLNRPGITSGPPRAWQGYRIWVMAWMR
ncbi:hypothetical protein MPL3365_230018 [Mesorhizobium plurifarium]|uniref:Uncharacterized protein n=1 Tax=Mesorhizobium plurifarium TaxID=69974 RepID=A0A090GAR2_MESPL|nr:hypothetical protein MPL3365_230018 [Mesorhizobium plurifarium]